jgi:tellurite resistance protein
VDDALLAVLIGAIHANNHLSADEGARAQHIIWSTRRFRRKSGDVVNRKIDRVKQLMERRGTLEVVEVAARALPPRFRKPAFAVAADLILVDGKMEGSERRFLTELALNLGLDKETTGTILDVIVIKNSI